jgi:hypothetical protein
MDHVGWSTDEQDQSRERVEAKKPESYGFESFTAAPYADIVAQKLERKELRGARFELASRE